jgi:hypothetical protein
MASIEDKLTTLSTTLATMESNEQARVRLLAHKQQEILRLLTAIQERMLRIEANFERAHDENRAEQARQVRRVHFRAARADEEDAPTGHAVAPPELHRVHGRAAPAVDEVAPAENAVAPPQPRGPAVERAPHRNAVYRPRHNVVTQRDNNED